MSEPRLGTCTLCEDRPATTTFGFPVCAECEAVLTSVQNDLAEMEAEDPELAELGRLAETEMIGMAEKAGAVSASGAEEMRRRLTEAGRDAVVERLRSRGERPADWDEDDHRLADAVAMVGRCGAQGITIGLLVDDPPPGTANWYAAASFRRGTLTTEPRMTPVAAAETLAEMLQDRATCRWCGRRISWGERPARSERRRRCWWRKIAGRWERGCPSRDTPAVPDSMRP